MQTLTLIFSRWPDIRIYTVSNMSSRSISRVSRSIWSSLVCWPPSRRLYHRGQDKSDFLFTPSVNDSFIEPKKFISRLMEFRWYEQVIDKQLNWSDLRLEHYDSLQLLLLPRKKLQVRNWIGFTFQYGFYSEATPDINTRSLVSESRTLVYFLRIKSELWKKWFIS